jgi:hypothetical protein
MATVHAQIRLDNLSISEGGVGLSTVSRFFDHWFVFTTAHQDGQMDARHVNSCAWLGGC